MIDLRARGLAVTAISTGDLAYASAALRTKDKYARGLAAKFWARGYVGQLSTGTGMLNTLSAPNKQFMSRKRMYAREAMHSIQVVLANWYGNTEASPGAVATVTASIEYPSGTFTQILFSGLAAGTIANGGQIISDQAAVNIPRNAAYWVRVFYQNTAGIIYNDNFWSNAAGDGGQFAASGLTDLTMSGTVSTSGGVCYPPIAVFGKTQRATVGIIGDSINYGTGGTGNISTDSGSIAPSLGPTLAYINLGLVSAQASAYVASHAKRELLLPYVTHIICELGINDIINSRTAAQLVTSIQAIRALYPTKPFYITTLGPNTTSTDSWTTTVNQTVAASEAQRVAYNDLVRAGIVGVTGYFEIADALETARNSGLWKVTGVANGYTAGGLHPNAAGYALIPSSGAINPALFVR